MYKLKIKFFQTSLLTLGFLLVGSMQSKGQIYSECICYVGNHCCNVPNNNNVTCEGLCPSLNPSWSGMPWNYEQSCGDACQW